METSVDGRGLARDDDGRHFFSEMEDARTRSPVVCIHGLFGWGEQTPLWGASPCYFPLEEMRRSYSGKVVAVHNYANQNEVNGPIQNKNNMTLCGRAINDEDTSKLAVAPCFLPNFFAGPYWVLGIGTDYRWAIVIGGQPTEQFADGCTTREEGTYNSARAAPARP